MIARVLDTEGNVIAEGYTPKWGPENPIEFKIELAGTPARIEVSVEVNRPLVRALPGDTLRVDVNRDPEVPPGLIRVG